MHCGRQSPLSPVDVHPYPRARMEDDNQPTAPTSPPSRTITYWCWCDARQIQKHQPSFTQPILLRYFTCWKVGGCDCLCPCNRKLTCAVGTCILSLCSPNEIPALHLQNGKFPHFPPTMKGGDKQMSHAEAKQSSSGCAARSADPRNALRVTPRVCQSRYVPRRRRGRKLFLASIIFVNEAVFRHK